MSDPFPSSAGMRRRAFVAATSTLLATFASPGVLLGQGVASLDRRGSESDPAPGRRGRVRVVNHGLIDDGGPFLGLGASYFTALWRCKNDRARFHSDLRYLAQNRYNYIRILSMVGHHPAWNGREIAPVTFARRDGKKVDAWGDYWNQMRELVDLAYDRHGLRTQITIFADAQLMPEKKTRLQHMERLLREVVTGREHKLILLEVANEAWQNGFPGDAGVADLREFATYLNQRTEVPIAITSNHDYPELGSTKGFEQLYGGNVADIATWHFSRDRRTAGGWAPVYDCWALGELPGLPPVSSNEPIGPGSSVNTERDPLRLVMAAAFAYAARLPMYVFHCEAGVFGKTRFEDTPAINQYGPMLDLLPPDLPQWQRSDSRDSNAVFTVFAGGNADRFWPELAVVKDGCVRNATSRKGDQFICVPIGIRSEGLELQARHAVEFTAYDPLTGRKVAGDKLAEGEKVRLPGNPGALILRGRNM